MQEGVIAKTMQLSIGGQGIHGAHIDTVYIYSILHASRSQSLEQRRSPDDH